MGDEQIWTKRGSRVRLPSIPRPSRATLLRATPSVGVVSLSLVGLLAVPAGSPPPPPAVAAAPIASTEPVPTPSPEPTDTPSPVEQPQVRPVCHPRGFANPGLPPASRDGGASTIAYSHGSGIWLYGISTNSARELVRGTSVCGFYFPRFIDRRTIAFADDASDLHTVDILTGAIHSLPSHLPGHWPDRWLAAYDIATGRTMAELGRGQLVDGRTSYELAVSSLTTRKLIFSKQLGLVCECDGGDPLSLEWSRDGSLLAVGVTTSSESLVYVFDRSGKQALVPQKGFGATWLAGTHTLIFGRHGTHRDVWTHFDIANHNRFDFLPGRSLESPIPSPDGSKVAFTDDSRGRVVVFDFNSRTSKTLQGAHAYPLWLDGDRVAAAAVVSCICEGPQFQPSGKVDSISLSTGRVVRLVLGLTWGVDLY